MRRFAGLFLAACMTVTVPAATVCYAEEVITSESIDDTSQDTENSGENSQEAEKKELTIAQSLDGIIVPANAEQITYTYHGNVCTAAKTDTGLYLLPVVQEDGTAIWYVYNEEVDDAIPYIGFSGIEVSYAIILPNSDVTVPAGYEQVNINVAGRTVPAWFNSKAGDENMYLIYAMSSKGEKGLYRFDGTTGTCLRFVTDPDVELENTASSLSDELSELKANYESMSAEDSEEINRLNSAASLQQQNYNNLQERMKQYMLIGIVAFAVAAFLMLVFFIMMIRKSSKLKKSNKKLAEAENALRNVRAQRRSADAPARRTRREDMPDTRMTEGREEGTSRVRRVQRSQDRGFEQSTTTSKVVRVPREQAPEQTVRRTREQTPEQSVRSSRGQAVARPTGAKPAARPAASARPAAQSQERTVRRPAAQPRTQRPAAPLASRPTGETKIFDKAPADSIAKVRDLEELDDVKETRTKSSADIDMISEQLSNIHVTEASPVEDDFIEIENTDTDELYADDVDDDDFSLTDFRDI